MFSNYRRLLLLLPLDLDAQTFVPGLQFRRVFGAEILRLENGTDLEHGNFARHRNGAATRPGNGLFHRLHFPDPEARNEFLGLGKWAIDDSRLAARELDALGFH